VKAMNEFNFELAFKLYEDENPEAYLDALFEAGCDDALVGIGNTGYIDFKYTCEPDQLTQTLKDALCKIKKAIPHATLDKVEPFLLNSTELAYHLGFSKQNMRKYTRNESSIDRPFPTPAVPGKTSYWYLYEVASWFTENTTHKFERDHITALKGIVALNRVIANSRLPISPKEDKHYRDILECA
jgi:hypothetical protein